MRSLPMPWRGRLRRRSAPSFAAGREWKKLGESGDIDAIFARLTDSQPTKISHAALISRVESSASVLKTSLSASHERRTSLR